MSENLNPNPITLLLNEAKPIFFETYESLRSIKKVPSLKEYGFDLSVQTNADFENDLYETLLKIKVHLVSDNELKEILAEIHSSFKFFIKDLKKHTSNDKDGKLSLPTNLYLTCMGVSLSTTRGMLSVYLAETIISNCVVPLVAPKVFFDLVSKIEQMPPKTKNNNLTKSKRNKKKN